MKRHSTIAILLGFLAAGSLLHAQSADTVKNQYNEKVLVTAPYQPGITLAEKPVFSPQAVDTALPAPDFDYEIISRPFATKYPIDNI